MEENNNLENNGEFEETDVVEVGFFGKLWYYTKKSVKYVATAVAGGLAGFGLARMLDNDDDSDDEESTEENTEE